MKIAVIGSGISGLTAGYLLSRNHEVVMYEAASRLGGHTATIATEVDGKVENIDTGFIVYNDWTYPNFIALMKALNIPGKPTEMGFSVTTAKHDFEYCGSSIGRMFSQRRNILNPHFYGMLADILNFNRRAKEAVHDQRLDSNMNLMDYLSQFNYGRLFLDYYIVPMASAIWSCSGKEIEQFQALFFLQFFYHHGLLNINDRPQWHVIKRGSFQYIEPITARFKENIRLNEAVLNIDRCHDHVDILTSTSKERFDYVVIASHSDQALRMLSQPTPQEQAILGAISYRDNSVIMHTDTAVMPRQRRAWTSWNYLVDGSQHQQPVVTYHMNTLQGLTCDTDILVTVNGDTHIDPEKIKHRFSYAHPQLTQNSVAAQQQWETINNQNRTLYCGAYWRNGFHEDGVYSARRAVESIGERWL